MKKSVTRGLLSSDDTELFQDSPIGIQVVGRTYEEEAVIGMAEIIVAALESHKVPAEEDGC